MSLIRWQPQRNGYTQINFTWDPFNGTSKSTGGSQNPWSRSYLNPGLHHHRWWLWEENILRATTTPIRSCPIDLYQLSGIESSIPGFKKFKHLCTNKVVIFTTDNTSMVAYINKQGGMKLDRLGALLWRILIWCNNQVILKSRHIPGRLNFIANNSPAWPLRQSGLSTKGCSRRYVDGGTKQQWNLFATMFNKLPPLVSPDQ